MKKLLFIVFALTASSQAFANWYCVARSPVGGWGAWTSPYQNTSRINAMQACQVNTPHYSYCVIQSCVWTGTTFRYYW